MYLLDFPARSKSRQLSPGLFCISPEKINFLLYKASVSSNWELDNMQHELTGVYRGDYSFLLIPINLLHVT